MGKIQLPFIPNECNHNAHMFYIKAKDLDERTKLISYLKSNGINSVFHYIPLHTAPAGKKYGEFVGEDVYTTKESERLLRLPLYYGMKKFDVKSNLVSCHYNTTKFPACKPGILSEILILCELCYCSQVTLRTVIELFLFEVCVSLLLIWMCSPEIGVHIITGAKQLRLNLSNVARLPANINYFSFEVCASLLLYCYFLANSFGNLRNFHTAPQPALLSTL